MCHFIHHKFIIKSVFILNKTLHLVPLMNYSFTRFQEAGNPTKFQVENSWGDEFGEKGYLVISRDWFLEFVFEVVVDKKFVPQEIMEVFTLKPIVLPAWDPMGKLAQ